MELVVGSPTYSVPELELGSLFMEKDPKIASWLLVLLLTSAVCIGPYHTFHFKIHLCK